MANLPIASILKYYWDAQTIFSAHSPFVYHFMKVVMRRRLTDPILIKIEEERNSFLRSNDSISFVDYGAGSIRGSNQSNRKVSDVAGNSLSGKWQCQILYQMIKEYKICHVLELGTSLGISTAYLASAAPGGRVVTMEGNPASAALAQELWNRLELKNIEVKLGPFEENIPDALMEVKSLGLVFLDGNHRKEATLRYFDQLRPHIKKSSIIVVDDIYWSKGMYEAWQTLKNDDQVAFSLDLYRMGILFFDQATMPRQHFKLIQYKFKPWSIGVFG